MMGDGKLKIRSSFGFLSNCFVSVHVSLAVA